MTKQDELARLADDLRLPLSSYFALLTTFYEENTWTPALVGATTPGTFTYSTQAGRYTRYGNIVVARARIVLTAVPGAPAGGLRLSGLPFTVANANGIGDGYIGLLSQFNMSAGALFVTIQAVPNQTYAAFFEVFDNAANGAAPSTGVNATFSLSCTVVYEAAA